MNITVIGCGRWGSFIAWYLCGIGHRVTLYGRESSVNMKSLLETRKNGFLTLPNDVQLSTRLDDIVKSEIVVISISSQSLSGLLESLKPFGLKQKVFVLCMKGIEIETGRRLSEIAIDALDPSCETAVWLGPGHVQEFVKAVPNCMVIDGYSQSVKKELVEQFSSKLIRFYYGGDIIGNEIGAAAKNIIGIAAGVLDGLKLSTLKGALMSRGTREIARLISAMGGNELSAYGLCHLGDYEATVFSQHSHNRRFGELLVSGQSYDKLAEGYHTAKAIMLLSEKYRQELPICSAIYELLYKDADPLERIGELFTRSIKNEF